VSEGGNFYLGDRALVILGYKTGQLGNRLFHYSHWLANLWEYGYRLYNPSFDEYGKYFYKKDTLYKGGEYLFLIMQSYGKLFCL